MPVNVTPPPVCDYEGSDYQTSFWDRADRAYEDQAEAAALQRLLPASGDRLLEIGAGAGRNTPRYGGFRHITLLDYSRTQLRQAQERLGRHERYLFVAADAYRLPFIPGVFDAATMIRTLHHMADPERVLQQVRQVLRPGGVFILEYANKRNLKAILRYAARRQAWNPFSPEPVEFARLNFDFHPRAVREWLKQSSFDLERQLTVSHFRLGVLKRIIPLRVLVGMDTILQPTGNLFQLTPSVFTRSRASGDAPAARHPSEPLLTIFRCPECGATPLTELRGPDDQLEALVCPACGRAYPVEDGIYIFK